MIASEFLRSNLKQAVLALAGLLVSLVRNKMTAVLLGPDGVGLLGLLQNWINLVSRISSLGLSTVGTQIIAKAVNDDSVKRVNTLAQLILVVPLIIAGSIALLMVVWPQLDLGLSQFSPKASYLFLLTIALLLTVLYMSTESIVRALNLSSKLALTNLYTNLAAVICAGLVMVQFGVIGIYVLLLLVPLLAVFALSRELSPILKSKLPSLEEVGRFVKTVVPVGLPVILSVPFVLGGQYISRIMIMESFGTTSLGYFQAACTLSFTAVGFLVTAMNLHYYPKLTQVINQSKTDAVRLINNQIRFGMAVGLPLVLVLLFGSGQFLKLLYASDFVQGREVMRFQLLGDYVRLLYMPILFVSIATSRTKYYFLTEVAAGLAYLAAVYMAVYVESFDALGQAGVVQSCVYVVMCYFLANLNIQYRIDRKTLGFCVVTLVISICVLGLT